MEIEQLNSLTNQAARKVNDNKLRTGTFKRLQARDRTSLREITLAKANIQQIGKRKWQEEEEGSQVEMEENTRKKEETLGKKCNVRRKDIG